MQNLKLSFRSENIKKTLIFLIVVIFYCKINAQTKRIAIIDFENTSGIVKYNGLGKAMSSMLISDIESNVSPKKIQLIERSQILKIIKEQNFQVSGNVDKSTSVKAGKLLGANYMLVGDVFVLNEVLTINARLINTETGDIVFSKKQEGKTVSWLALKTNIAKDISTNLAVAFTSPRMPDIETPFATITSFANAINAKDIGDTSLSIKLIETIQEFNTSFKYIDDLKDEIRKLNQKVDELENITGILTTYFELGKKAEQKSNYESAVKYFEKFISNPDTIGFTENKRLYAFSKLAFSYFKLDDIDKALINADKAIQIYKFYPEANEIQLLCYLRQKKIKEIKSKYAFIIDSLSFDNEIDFMKTQNNSKLVWSLINRFYYGLKQSGDIEDNEEVFWVYSGITERGYGNSVKNDLELNKTISKNNLNISDYIEIYSQYEKIESKLLSYNDPKIFASGQILKFYKLSLNYADELYKKNKHEIYFKHLEKEIKRLENYGIPLDYEKCYCYKRIPFDWDENEGWEKSNSKLWDLGLSNSFKEIREELPLIYGQFLFKKLIFLIKENQLQLAAEQYRKVMSSIVQDRNSYFFEYYWDFILGLRTINENVNSQNVLDNNIFEKKWNSKIEKELTKEKIPLSNFEKIKTFKIPSIGDYSENDTLIGNIRLSKIIDISSLFPTLEIKLASNKEELNRFIQDSIPAYCYFNFDAKNNNPLGKLYNYSAMKLISQKNLGGYQIAKKSDYSQWPNLNPFNSSRGVYFNNEFQNQCYIWTNQYYNSENLSLMTCNSDGSTVESIFDLDFCKQSCFSILLIREY
jgi:TolB-like protein